MHKEIDVSDLPQPLVEAIESIVRTFRENSSPTANKRPIGWLRGQWELPDSFFEPLPDDLLDLFEGKSEQDE